MKFQKIILVALVALLQCGITLAANVGVDDSVLIKISLKEAPPETFPLIKVDFVGVPQVQKGNRIVIEPEVNTERPDEWHGGFWLELTDAQGQAVPFKKPGERIRFSLPDLTDQALRVTKDIVPGEFYSFQMPVGDWFDFKKPGVYHLKVHYRIFEDSTRWLGPVTSNDLTFEVK